jgi:hypothetical protein
VIQYQDGAYFGWSAAGGIFDFVPGGTVGMSFFHSFSCAVSPLHPLTVATTGIASTNTISSKNGLFIITISRWKTKLGHGKEKQPAQCKDTGRL